MGCCRELRILGTAGLGRDAFVLAGLGCKVIMVERHPVVAALLEDGLRRAYDDSEIGEWMRERMSLFHGSSIDKLADAVKSTGTEIDVVYLDPMYPHREKSALVKKEMRVFQTLVGADLDADGLLKPAQADGPSTRRKASNNELPVPDSS